MLKTVTLRTLEPWSRLNEYEGQVVAEIEGREFTCYVLMTPKEGWQVHRPGETLQADLWLERHRSWETAPAERPPYLRQTSGVHYELVGSVLEVAGERLTVDADFVLTVDLEADAAATSTLKVGDKVRVEGTLKLELDPDPD